MNNLINNYYAWATFIAHIITAEIELRLTAHENCDNR